MKPNYLNNSGLSIVATVMIMLILALFAAAAVSLVTTSTGTGIQEERGVEAFYIAEGGMQYTLKLNTYPYYTISTSTNLGDGSFTVSVPTLNSGIDTDDDSLAVAPSTEGFKAAPDGSYWALLCDTASDATPAVRMASSDCEKISCPTKTTTSLNGTCSRGRDSTSAANHLSNAVLMTYSWNTSISTTLARNLVKGAKCKNPTSTICVNSTNGFATSGFIRVHYDNGASNNNEDIFYEGTGSDATACGTGCTACLGTTSCTRRAYDSDGTGNGTINHSSISGPTIYQSEFSVLVTSTGEVPGAIILSNIKRVLQTNVLPLKDP